MSEPESKKLEERLEAILADRGPLDPYLSPSVWEVARDALATLREKHEEIARLKAQLQNSFRMAPASPGDKTTVLRSPPTIADGTKGMERGR